MTPKEKAEELMLKFREAPIKGTLAWYVSFELSKRFALIAVDEIIETFIPKNNRNYLCEEIEYWEEVKQEIEKL
jgi:hypothetical protein